MSQYPISFTWARKAANGYECSSKGDKRFSAFGAYMPDGRTIEAWYQCDVKGYNPGGTDWQAGKGKPPVVPYLPGQMYQAYLGLWRLWAVRNPGLMVELYEQAKQHRVLTDMFAAANEDSINQARALAQILNEWIVPEMKDGI